GDLLVKISTEKTGGDEIGQLLTSLKTMVDNVRKLVNDIRELGESVAASAQEMMSSSEDVSKAAEHIAGSINDLAKGASTQAALTEKGNSDLQGVIEGLSEIKLKMNESEGLVNHALEAVNHGQKSVQNQESTMIANRKTTSQINLTIYNLSQMSTEIEEILGVIRGVAEQTNLLAINAAIEAARAKEQGRGFAVVAQQVKNLSEQSGTSVENISTIIHNLQANIARIVEEMNQLDSATEEQEKSIINTVNLFGNLTESVNTIANHITMVSQSANKLAHSAGHAGSSMEEIAGIAQATAANSEEVSASSEEQTAYFEQIAASAGQLADISSQLLAGIHRFSV
ncbi:MAG TPA: methyl-accepting chemotaxis protein, partial [Firmicutes bacterium]|nr:methyl-accepting chemotaxis protein [Bacillota bacterium]